MKRPISANSQSPNPLQAPKQPTLRHPRPKHPTRLNHSPTLEPFPAPEAPVGNKSPRPTSTTRPTHYQPFIPAALRNVPSSTIAGTSNQSSENASGSNSAYTGSFSNSTVAKTPLNAPRSSATTRGTAITPQYTVPTMPASPPIPHQSFYHASFQTDYGLQPWSRQDPHAAAPQTQQQCQSHGQLIHATHPQVESGQYLPVLPYLPLPTSQVQPVASSRTLPQLNCNGQVQAESEPPVLPPIESIPMLAPPATADYQLYPTYTSTPRNSPATLLLQCDHDGLREKMAVRQREIKSLNSQKQYWSRELIQFERNRLLNQLEGLRTFEAAQTEDFASAQKDYFDLLGVTDYAENAGILGPLTILLKLEEVIATMTAEYYWCRNVLANVGVDIGVDDDL
ncbi:hypothetical protein B0I72DRAFT_165293 [Yarrowia lipolytica]|nr:hypothetical protein B0I72DRAFT_165293 [Yarrowia lipolytica]RDW40553.1 hypothetical protein B0I73DRAFT_164268 [Yarrowia lipolytica]RDW44361.1 hypothetical protein B0I74DRAFT_164841 [Yarrowia lipolytica]RDW51263.1 hypothetical protein B0I75DRAFT_170225 [Yarrowia lipolytica]